VHGEQRAEEHRRPAQLRRVVKPTAEHKDQQISGLVQDVEWRMAFEAVAREIVDRGEKD